MSRPPLSTTMFAKLATIGATVLWCVLASVASATPFGQVPAAEPMVRTTGGVVTGTRKGRLDLFLGIPYAAPPIGELRWRPPMEPQPWLASRRATAFGPSCMQVAPEGFSKPSLQEDCLYLNVVRRSDAVARAGKAVMVWIHGGGLRQGRADDYDPSALVEQGDVVFVSFNYRLNILGFFANPALDAEHHAFANYGFMDQQFALAWVRKNIAAFGGDPNKVTLIGESAGGSNVFDHMVAAGSKGLFRQAIVQSGSYWNTSLMSEDGELALDVAEQRGSRAAALAGCAMGDARCLRSVPITRLAEVVRQLPSTYFNLAVDGHVVSRTTREAILAGDFNHVPLINGTNNDEWTWVEGLNELKAGRPLSLDEMPNHLADYFGSFTDRILRRYSAGEFSGSAGATVAAAETDGMFVCPLLAANRSLAQHTKVWGYEFADDKAPAPFQTVSFPYRAAHTLELRYLFNDYTGAVGQLRPMTGDQKVLAAEMVDYWTRFAKTGDPNSSEEQRWRPLGNNDESYLMLVPPHSQIVPASKLSAEHRCDMWQQIEQEGTVHSKISTSK